MAKIIYKIQVPQGSLPYEFETEEEAKNYAIGILSWQGLHKYRIQEIIVETKEEINHG
jgi:hypothetical protein